MSKAEMFNGKRLRWNGELFKCKIGEPFYYLMTRLIEWEFCTDHWDLVIVGWGIHRNTDAAIVQLIETYGVKVCVQ